MSKPINIAVLSKSLRNESTNNVQIQVIDDKTKAHTLNISPQAQEQLLTALLAHTPLGSAGKTTGAKAFLTSKNIRVFEGPDKTLGLEFLLGNQIAIHILLPGLLPDSLLNQLQQFRDLSSDVPRHSGKSIPLSTKAVSGLCQSGLKPQQKG